MSTHSADGHIQHGRYDCSSNMPLSPVKSVEQSRIAHKLALRGYRSRMKNGSKGEIKQTPHRVPTLQRMLGQIRTPSLDSLV